MQTTNKDLNRSELESLFGFTQRAFDLFLTTPCYSIASQFNSTLGFTPKSIYMYKADRINKVIQSEAFVKFLAKSRKRKGHGAKQLRNKTEAIDWANTVQIVTKFGFGNWESIYKQYMHAQCYSRINSPDPEVIGYLAFNALDSLTNLRELLEIAGTKVKRKDTTNILIERAKNQLKQELQKLASQHMKQIHKKESV